MSQDATDDAADATEPLPIRAEQQASGFHAPYRASASGPRHSSGFALGGSADMPSLGDLMYGRRIGETYPIAAGLRGPGTFETVPGHDPAPGTGRVVRYRVDVENDVPLDGRLFARAVHETLNDARSWGADGRRTFERVPAEPATSPSPWPAPAPPGTGAPCRASTPPSRTSRATPA